MEKSINAKDIEEIQKQIQILEKSEKYNIMNWKITFFK